MLRIVHVLHSLGVGGTENGVVNLANALGDEFQQTVIAMTERGPLADRLSASVPVYCLGKQVGSDLRVVVRLAVLLRRLAPNVVHSRNWGTFDTVLAARLAHVPIVIHGEHGREASDSYGQNRRRNYFRRLFAPLVSRFVTVSFDLQRWLVETVGIHPRKVLTIHNGVDTDRFIDEGRKAGRRALGLPPDVMVIGAVARLDPVKNQTGLVEAFAQVAAKWPSSVLVIVGDGPSRQELEARAQQADLAGRVHFLGERTDVSTLLKGFDIFVLPSLYEGISNTILEAMATGLPVVATRTGGNPELVEDGVTGTLVPVGDPAALADTLRGYLADPHLRTTHGKAGRQRAVDEFRLERMVERYRALYLSLVRVKVA